MEIQGWHLADQPTYRLVDWLKKHNYPKPIDCPEGQCPLYRPECVLGVCVVASKRTYTFLEGR